MQKHKALAFTGHRPESLPFGENELSASAIRIKATLADEIMRCAAQGYDTFLAGGARGWDILFLFSYAFDDAPVKTIDLASGETLPQEAISALEDPGIIKVAYNAQFERVCLSRYLGHWLDPRQWRCTMVMAAYLTLPGRLADAAVALGTTEKKMEEGKDLIRYFSVPCKPTKTNGGRTRNLPADAPEKWAVYRQYNAQDVETERAIRKALEKYPLPEQEWELYALDQQINDRGVRVDKKLVKNVIAVDAVFAQAAYQRAKELTGLENPGSVNQLKAWLADQDMPIESLARKIVQEKAAQTNGIVAELLAHALLTLEKNGYPVVFHVHDEAVIEMPIGQGALEEACRLMAIAPDWAKDLPLRADGYECAYYQKS